MMEKRYKNGTIGAFYVGIEGNLLDADAINLVGPSKALIWVPRTAAAREQAAAILEQLAQLPLTDPRRKALKEVLRKVVSDDINGGGPNMVATDAAAPEAATSPRNDDRLPKGEEPAGERPGQAAKAKRSPATAGLSVSELEDVVSKVSAPGAKRVTIVQTEAELPAKVVARLRSEGVIGVRGMFDPETDSIWLVAGNIMSPKEAVFVLMHEGVHRGLRVFFGNDLTPILQQIYDTNRSVALRADLYRAKHKIDLMEAIEEVLADMAMKGDAKTLKGWDKLVAFIRKWVKELGDRLGLKLVFTDEMVEQLVSAASTVGLRDDVQVFDDMVAKTYGIKLSTRDPGQQGNQDGIMSSPTESELKEKSKAAERGEKEPKPALGKKVTVDQADIFNTQGTLFSRAIPVAQQVKNAVQKRRGYKGAAQVIIDRIDRAITPLGGLSNAGRYLKDRYQALGKIANADAIGKSLYDAFAKHAPETQQQVYEYLTTRDADENDIVDAKVRESAVRAKQIIEQVGEQLVARGFIDPAVMEAHRGAYLPRLYLKHMLTEADSRAIGAGKKPSSMGYLKARRDIPEDVRNVILGEIKDPGFLSAVGVTRAMRDMAILDWLAQISKEKEWVFPESMVEFEGREVSVLWLKAEADRIRQQIPYYTGTVKTKAEDLVKRMDAVVTPRLEELQAVPEDFKQMPDSPRYGHLRGLYVRKEIYDDIVGVGAVVPKDAGFMEKLLGYGGWATKATQLWKASKVSLNPPGQIRNFLSNLVLLKLSGVPLHMVPVRLAQAAKELRTNGRYAQIAKKHGVSVASFAAQELLHIERDFIDLKARMRGPWSLMHLVNIGAKIMDKAGNLYQWSESLYKTAKIIDEMEKGASESDAAIEAHKWLMDYSLVGPNIKYVRNAPVGIPFATFYVKLAPRLAEVALHHPQRFAPWAIMAYTLPMIIAAMGGPDREEQEKLKKLLPEFWQDKGHVYVLPYKDEHGRWQAIDISYLMPWTMFDTVARKTVKGDIKSAVEATGIVGGPIPDIISAWKTGKDPFTGSDIVNPGDPQHLQWGSLLTYVYNLAMPPVITNRGLIGPDFGDPLHTIQGRLPSAVRGSTNKYGDTVSTVKQAAAGAVGFNTRSVNPNERALKLNRMRAEMNDVKDRLKRSLGDRAISSEERKRLLKTYADEIRRRQEKIKEFAQATQ